MTAFFQPPTEYINPSVLPETRGIQYELWKYYGPQPVGCSVVRIDGHYQTVCYPSQDVLTGVDGVDYFLGGHEYIIPNDVADDLIEDGYGGGGDDGIIEYTNTWQSHEDESWAEQAQWGGM